VLPALLEQADLGTWSSAVHTLREQLVGVLEEHDCKPDHSDANFVLVRDAPTLRDHLARHRVLVRDTTSFGWPGGVRVAVPDSRGLERLDAALRTWSRP
jgi:histidinol-phosphate/aromatic aminotransferase/cobyric acid decarboxylase-like protein